MNRYPSRSAFFLLSILTVLAAPAYPERTLTLPQAMDLAIQNNLNNKLAHAGTEEARGRALESASALLPRMLASLGQSRTFKVNLAAQGFPANNPFFSPLVGPFNTFDARIQLVQQIFNLNALWTAQAGRRQVDIARFQEELAKEQVASAAALAYLEALRSLRAVQDAQANATLAENLRNLARDQHRSGVSTGVDVARAETRAAQQNLRLIRAQVTAHEDDLRLKRVVGLPLTEAIALGNPLQAAPLPGINQESTLIVAQQHRYELSIVKARLEADTLALHAAEADHLPVIRANADYGFSGNLPDSTVRTGSIGGRLELPIFYGGQIRGEVKQAEGLKTESEARYRDTRDQVEEDVRLALQTLTAEAEEVKTANQTVQLAQRELQMAKDRFSAGVGDNIQLLSAQTALADAEDDQVEALTRYTTTRINLALAMGEMQKFQL